MADDDDVDDDYLKIYVPHPVEDEEVKKSSVKN